MKIWGPAHPAARAKKGDGVARGRRIVDTVKSRSTLVGTVQPIGMTVSLLSQGGRTFHELGQVAGSLVQGNFGQAGQGFSGFISQVFHPTGIGGRIFKSGLGLAAAASGVVGSVEVYNGIKNHDKYLAAMGGADLLGMASALLLATGNPVAALAVGSLSVVTQTSLVFGKPKEYSVIQKGNSVFNLISSISNSMVYANLCVLPAFAVNAVASSLQMLYMNNKWVRNKVNGLVEALRHKEE